MPNLWGDEGWQPPFDSSGFQDATPRDDLFSDGISSEEDSSMVLGEKKSFYRRKSRTWWFLKGHNGLAEGWENLVYAPENLGDFAAKFRAAYYGGTGAWGDSNDPDFYFLRQGDVIVGRALLKESDYGSDDPEYIDVTALVGEVEPNVRGKIQDNVPDEYTFSINMGGGKYSSHTLTFVTSIPGDNCPECETYVSLGTSSTWGVSVGTCIEFDKIVDVSAQSDSEGTTLKFKKRKFRINSCGETVRIAEEVDHDVEIPCCDTVFDDPCEDGVEVLYRVWLPATPPQVSCGLLQTIGGVDYLPFYELDGVMTSSGDAAGGPGGGACGLDLFTGRLKSRSGSSGACELTNWSHNADVINNDLSGNVLWVFPDGTWQWDPPVISGITYTTNQTEVSPAGQVLNYFIEPLTIG